MSLALHCGDRSRESDGGQVVNFSKSLLYILISLTFSLLLVFFFSSSVVTVNSLFLGHKDQGTSCRVRVCTYGNLEKRQFSCREQTAVAALVMFPGLGRWGGILRKSRSGFIELAVFLKEPQIEFLT